MIEIIKELNVEVTKPNIFQALVAKQYDMNTRFLKVTLMDCGTRIEVPAIETAKVVINAERKDGQSKGFDGVINNDGTVTVPLHSWMLELDGTVTCDISVIDTATDDNKKLTTTSFTLLVEKAAYGGDDITSDPQYDVLVNLLETCATAGATAEEALQKSNEANAKYDACVAATEQANTAANNANEAANKANTTVNEIEQKLENGEFKGEKGEDGVGRATAEGGEIFNDYENNKALSQYSTAKGSGNVAGTKAFKIAAWDETAKTYTLDSVEGISISDRFSIEWVASHIDCGVITGIDTTNNIVTVSIDYVKIVGTTETAYEFITNDESEGTKLLFIHDKPWLGTTTLDFGAYAEGNNNLSLRRASHAEGRGNKSLDSYAHTEGRDNVAAYASHAEGRNNFATGEISHAEGRYTKSLGSHSHAEGSGDSSNYVIAKGDSSHAEGKHTKAYGQASHSEGYGSEAKGQASHAEGENTVADGENSHAEGNISQATGENSHAEGYGTKATNLASHSEGYGTTASGKCAHSEGNSNEATGENSHAEGENTTASGNLSHTEGGYTTASGNGSHAEGFTTRATGENAHAEGGYTKASGAHSHAGGWHTIAGYEAQTVIGKFNENKDDTLFEVGNGAGETARSNAFEVKKDGSIVVGGVTLTPEQLTKLLALINE